MNRILFTQVWNERRSNSWLWIELLLVYVVLWFVIDMCYVDLRTFFEPKGHDISNTYMIQVNTLPPNNPDYQDKDKKKTTGGQDLLELVNRLKRFDGVEAVSISINSYPYNGSNSGTGIKYDTINAGSLRRLVTPDFFRVFRIEGINGESPQKLASLMKEGVLIVGDNLLLSKHNVAGKELLNKTIYINGDTTQGYKVAAVTKPVRYDDFASLYSWGSRYISLLFSEKDIAQQDDNNARFDEVCFWITPEKANGFVERLRAASGTQFRVGNMFLGKIFPMEEMRRTHQMDDMNELYSQMWGVAFLLFNIFLGLLGTFWFRTQQRRSEIALHLSCGSTKRQVFNRLLSEGFLLLLIAVAVGIIISLNIVYMGFLEEMDEKVMTVSRFLITAGTTLLLMALTMVGGIWIPARQAMKIQPAVALREE
ncbi:ABC transporter permease [Bacteroides graminisolvens]